MVSFGYDYHWALQDSRFDLEKHIQCCTVCRAGKTCYHLLQERGVQSDRFAFITYLSYLAYAPLYLAGPILSFNAFASQAGSEAHVALALKCGRPSVRHRTAPAWARLHPSGLQQRPRLLSIPGESAEFQFSGQITQNFKQSRFGRKTGIRWTRRGWKVVGDTAGVRWGGGSPAPYGGERRDVRTLRAVRTGMWKQLYPVDVFIIGYGICGIEVPENMPKCVNNCYNLESFWKNWHASYNKWLVRYLYIPLGGSQRKLLNVWVVFTFVAIWHDLEWKLLSWAWLTCLFFIPEIIFKSAANAFQAKTALGEFIVREFSAAAGAITITCLMAGSDAHVRTGLKVRTSLCSPPYGAGEGAPPPQQTPAASPTISLTGESVLF
ncbi:hypothetical protein ACLB2K_006962 [Fragaria x ananassa]